MYTDTTFANNNMVYWADYPAINTNAALNDEF
jgi:hypothetical protein